MVRPRVPTQYNAFEDFVKSAEGVPRDAFNVLSIAAQRSLADKISIPTDSRLRLELGSSVTKKVRSVPILKLKAY